MNHYNDLVIGCLAQFGKISRSDIHGMLLKKISDTLTDNQKKNVITNLLQKIRHEKAIKRVGGKRGRGARWTLYKHTEKSEN